MCDEDYPIAWSRLHSRSGHLHGGRTEDKARPGEDVQRAAAPGGEDPTFRVFTNEETGQTIIAGMGELHLEIIRDRMFREFKVEANAGKPQIAYKETILVPADGEGKLIKQSGGRGQYGHVIIKVAPNARARESPSRTRLSVATSPKSIPACIKGLNEATHNGVIGGIR